MTDLPQSGLSRGNRSRRILEEDDRLLNGKQERKDIEKTRGVANDLSA